MTWKVRFLTWKVKFNCKKVTFAVADPESLRSSLPEALMEVFEQRSSRRVNIGETYAEVMVVCEDGRAATTGRILGISERGISARLDPRALHIIPEGANVSLSFRLPGSHNELHPWGLVRSVKPVDEGLVYGLEFLTHDTPDFDEIRREIRTFVAWPSSLQHIGCWCTISTR